MATEKIVLTDQDHARLSDLAVEVGSAADAAMARDADLLMGELERARKVPSARVPADVVTMKSTVRIRDLDSDDTLVCTLVWPGEADFTEGKISVLAPIGLALLGSRVGQTIEWEVPAGKRRFVVEELVHQPEASGEVEL
ncbi:MAG: nucleoside diphosphate kinase regulator [Candidatus Brocadiaceae bacterium]|nr:nucleoside diphosphate kinase regulator [Candidatus Brocadiaceae bacterium]